MGGPTIGSALVEKRAELGLEKGQAADKIGMSRTTYSSYEQDAQRPSVDVFPALAGFLDITIEELLVLYGASCIVAVRSSMERVMSNHRVRGDEEAEISGKSPLTNMSPQMKRGVPYEGTAMAPKGPESTPPDTTPKVPDQLESEEFEEPGEILESTDVRGEMVPPLEREGDVKESTVIGSVFSEPSLFVIKMPKSEGSERSSGHKKKKSKKQKKN